jgi:hypothetical protein
LARGSWYSVIDGAAATEMPAKDRAAVATRRREIIEFLRTMRVCARSDVL